MAPTAAQLLAFEAFRDLVKTAGQSEAAGLAAALEENLELRAVARAAANDGAGLTAARQRAPISSPATPAGPYNSDLNEHDISYMCM